MNTKSLFLSILIAVALPVIAVGDVFDEVKHHYADNEGVKIHYVTKGKGPVLVMLHGFPDFWYTWRHQIKGLSSDYKVVAVDLRGYNKSDKPKGVSSYAMPLLMKDVVAVLDHLEVEKATLIANDWGGAIAWQVATFYPNRVKRLIACNIPHPAGIAAFLQNNPTTGQYAQDFKKEGAEKMFTPETLAGLHPKLNQTERARYVNAFKNSSFEGMFNYYRANYPAPPKKGSGTSAPASTPAVRKVKAPVLVIHGMKDTALPTGMLNNTWDFVDNELTIHTIPNAGHFVQQEAPAKVNSLIKSWLAK